MKTEYVVADLLDEVQQDHRTFLGIVEGELGQLSLAQKTWKPAPDQWSVVECLAHLNLTNTYYIRQIQKKVDDAGRADFVDATRRFTMSQNGRLMLKASDPESKLKLPAPMSARPRQNLDPDAVFDRFIELENLLLHLIPQTVRLDLEASKVLSPFVNWLKFRTGDVLIFLTAHTRRHVEQALRVTRLPHFPKS